MIPRYWRPPWFLEFSIIGIPGFPVSERLRRWTRNPLGSATGFESPQCRNDFSFFETLMQVIAECDSDEAVVQQTARVYIKASYRDLTKQGCSIQGELQKYFAVH